MVVSVVKASDTLAICMIGGVASVVIGVEWSGYLQELVGVVKSFAAMYMSGYNV